jgi:hypothetical protein
MAHDLEQQNGETSFASFREPAWHGLGTVFTEEVNTSEMLSLAKLNNWNVKLEDMIIPDGYRKASNSFMVTRTNPYDNGTDILFHYRMKIYSHLVITSSTVEVVGKLLAQSKRVKWFSVLLH